MKGTQPVRIANKRVSFKFELHRSVTIVKGDSGSGKTTLYELIASHTRLGDASGVTIQCAKPCVALVDLDWKTSCPTPVIQSSLSMRAVRILSPKSLLLRFRRRKTTTLIPVKSLVDARVITGRLACDIGVFEVALIELEACLRILCQKSVVLRRPLPTRSHAVDVLLVRFIQPYEGVISLSACLDSIDFIDAVRKIVQVFPGKYDESVFVVADGAAFGAEADRVLKLQSLYASSVSVCLPESFEWLLLKSGLVDAPDLENVLADTSEYAESREYFSWEQFYTAYLQENTRDTVFRYTKRKLPEAFMVPENAARIMSEIAAGNNR